MCWSKVSSSHHFKTQEGYREHDKHRTQDILGKLPHIFPYSPINCCSNLALGVSAGSIINPSNNPLLTSYILTLKTVQTYQQTWLPDYLSLYLA